MATISSLAVKIKADVSGMTKDISDVIKSVEKMSSAVKTTRPNIENLSAAADGYGQVLKAVENAQANISGGLPAASKQLDAGDKFEKMSHRTGWRQRHSRG
ncbi:hypothetical protein FACS18942_02990 [Planctomycetales bacterium]|nr:hypothetical protein FACS18942_02990 [Planctomycetales bacterium]